MPPSVPRPELNVIIERLQIAVNCYDNIVCETATKLQMIKKHEELSVPKESVKEKQPESATEEINCILSRLDELNDMAERNLRHLREIVYLLLIKYKKLNLLMGIKEKQLIKAANNGNLNDVISLIEQGAIIRVCDDYVLRLAAENGHLDVVKYLIENGADMQSLDNAALRYAAEYGHLDVVKYLVEQGANIHALGDYALCHAIENKHLDVVNYLV